MSYNATQVQFPPPSAWVAHMARMDTVSYVVVSQNSVVLNIFGRNRVGIVHDGTAPTCSTCQTHCRCGYHTVPPCNGVARAEPNARRPLLSAVTEVIFAADGNVEESRMDRVGDYVSPHPPWSWVLWQF